MYLEFYKMSPIETTLVELSASNVVIVTRTSKKSYLLLNLLPTPLSPTLIL